MSDVAKMDLHSDVSFKQNNLLNGLAQGKARVSSVERIGDFRSTGIHNMAKVSSHEMRLLNNDTSMKPNGNSKFNLETGMDVQHTLYPFGYP